MNRFGFSPVTLSLGFLLSILSSHALPSTPLTCGSLISGTIGTAGQVNQYTYGGKAGGIVTLTLANTGGFNPFYGVEPSVTLFDPSGKTVLTFAANSQQQVSLLSTGTYLLQVSSSDLASTGTYNLGIVCRNPLQPASTLSCGGIASGNIAASAQVDQYTYPGQAGGIVTFTLTNTGGFNPFYGVEPSVTLFDPAGKVLMTFAANSQQQVTLALTGTYLFQISSSDLATTGTYNLGVECRNPLRNALPLSCGGITSGKIAAASQVDQYAYAGQAGGILSFNLVNTSGFNPFYGVEPSATLFDPTGKAILTFAANSSKETTLAWTGTYLVQVSSSDLASTGTYNLGVDCILGLTGEGFVPVTPCRIADTRSSSGFTGSFGPPSMTAGSTRNFPIPKSSCGIPETAQLYSLSVTAVPPAPLGYLSIWPTGELQPLVSTLNSSDGQVVANAAIVPAGSSGDVSVYVSNTTDVVIDIDGYFIPESAAAAAFYTDKPCRIADTRSGSGFTGAFGPPSMAAGSTRAFPILSSSCNIATTATAYSLNMTVVPLGALDYLSLWPDGESQPLVSTVNSFNGRIVANAALVPAGAPNGGVDVFVSNTTNLVIDIDGHFGPSGGTGALNLYPVSPCRIADTRSGSGFSGAFGPPSLVGGATRSFPIPSSSCGIPSTAQAYSLNMTVVPRGPLGYLTTWPTGQPQPYVSTLNSLNGTIVPNAALVPAGTAGAIDVFASNNTDLVIDITGYFAP